MDRQTDDRKCQWNDPLQTLFQENNSKWTFPEKATIRKHIQPKASKEWRMMCHNKEKRNTTRKAQTTSAYYQISKKMSANNQESTNDVGTHPGKHKRHHPTTKKAQNDGSTQIGEHKKCQHTTRKVQTTSVHNQGGTNNISTKPGKHERRQYTSREANTTSTYNQEAHTTFEHNQENTYDVYINQNAIRTLNQRGTNDVNKQSGKHKRRHHTAY